MCINEKSDTQKFWLTLIRDVFGIANPEEYVDFEKRVEMEHIKFIDAFIPSTGTIIEQKSPGKDLEAAFVQAKNYYDWLPFSQRGRYIVTCDFDEIHVHDMEEPTASPQVIPVPEATADELSFLLTPGETLPLEVRVSIKAGELIRKLYDSLLASTVEAVDKLADERNYTDEQRKALFEKAADGINVFCVRLVFILYAEDAGLFTKGQFRNYLAPRRIRAREVIRELFTVLNQKPERRDPFISSELMAFPLVDGGLFEGEVNFPQLNDEVLNIILHDMSEGFNWAGISPVIFGAIFESTLNNETRKHEGIHYTSPANIHKVIDPLFLDELTQTLAGILSEPYSEWRTKELSAFQEKLAALRFLDPACGSGNFLTESFISLRRLENKLLAAIPEGERPPVKVSITQFYGIESHPFAANVARTALWISDHQMWKETQAVMNTHDSPLPLKEYDNIKEGSAMATLENLGWKLPGWKIPHDDMLYIMGNPPFVGYSQQNNGQKQEVRDAFGQGKVDYVACWFMIAASYVQDKKTKAAFVATNSIIQGEQAAYVFKPISERWGIKIEFAYQPFVWKNELPDPSKMARVHVVIIGFSTNPPELKKLYTADGMKLVENINFYLADGPDEDVVDSMETAICDDVPPMTTGNRAGDGGNLIIEGEDYAEFIKREPNAARYIKRYMMGRDFINNIPRYCLWLVGASPHEIQSMPLVAKRVKACKADRLKGAPDRQKLADTPHLFREQMNPAHYVAIPVVSSEKRLYIPMGWLDDSVIPGDKLHIIPDATLYHFGVLMSRVHMAWMRRVGGRLKSDYSYSKNIVYNTFAWPSPTEAQRKRIEASAQAILDARALYPDSSLAELYNDAFMPLELRRAHRENDAAVLEAYGFAEDISEDGIVRGLFRLYHALTKK
ncbi:MAG: class I SAM-dependent DNA methyltransferase [Synergistaceae bacterium]|nr:class I SAM-dependent DNA methyltransferase [Synergistaceae bacterium]